ncbi:MAG: hypothetical protein ACI9ZF_000501 [Bradyrhizobium sp.]
MLLSEVKKSPFCCRRWRGEGSGLLTTLHFNASHIAISAVTSIVISAALRLKYARVGTMTPCPLYVRTHPHPHRRNRNNGTSHTVYDNQPTPIEQPTATTTIAACPENQTPN